MNKRQFLFQDGKSDKFWNIEVIGQDYHVNFGRTGTKGQLQIKNFASYLTAVNAADKLIAEKVKKGYLEQANDGTTPSPASKPTAPKPVVPSPPAPEPAPIVSEAVAPEPEPAVEETPSEAIPNIPNSAEKPEESLELSDLDWSVATWRPRKIQDKPVPKPFDYKIAMEKAKRVLEGTYGWEWQKAYLKPPFTKEEAVFWTTVFLDGPSHQVIYHNLPQHKVEVLKKLENLDLSGKIAPEEIVKQARDGRHNSDFPFTSLLFALFPYHEAIEMIFGIGEEDHGHHNFSPGLIRNSASEFRQHVLQYLSDEEVEVLQLQLIPALEKEPWPHSPTAYVSRAFALAATLGMSDFLEPKIQSWSSPTSPHAAYYLSIQRPQEVIFGLASAEAVNREMRRLELPLTTPQDVRAWLAHTEFSQLDYIATSIIEANNHGISYGTSTKDVAEALIKAFSLAKSAKVAPHMLRVMLESKAPRAAREWLEANPLHAIHGLLPAALGRGKFADAALQFLKALSKRGYEDHLRAAIAGLPQEDQARTEEAVFASGGKEYEPFTDENAPESIREALQDKKLARTRTGWVGATDLPPVVYGDNRLSDSQVDALISALRKPDHPLTLAVKATADPVALDEFAWQLFQAWLTDGANSKEKWAMLALGALGGDKSAIRLTPLVRAWPGESQHQRAVTGLECLRKIGTDTALMQLNGVAQKVKFKGLQAKAIEFIEAIASDRGLSRSQLEDRVIPDCGLDERGTRIFDFGPRQFRFVLSEDMKPMVREEGNKLNKPKPNLPAPNSKDDAAKSEAAVADWKLLKKQISEITKIQAVRLEQAMVKGRRWTPEEFDLLLAKHPLMTNLVRRLVWEAAAGNRRATFRLTEDGTYADHNDETFDLAGGDWAHVGIAHPMHIPDEEKRAWGEIFSDYEIVPPFVQIGRPVLALDPTEAQAAEITRFKDQKVQPQTLAFTLEKLDWERGPALDNGGFYEHYKYFENSGVTACVVYEPGLFMGGQEYWDPQQVTDIYFVLGWRSKRNNGYWDYPDKKKAIPLSEVDPVAISEVLKDVTEIVAKGEIK